MFPCIEIRPDGILHNLKIMKQRCSENGMSLSVVTKMLVGYEPLVRYLVEEGKIKAICDSRVENFMEFVDIKAEKWLIRSPMLSQVSDVVKFTDVSLNSELDVLRALNDEAKKQNKSHKVILMYECGDLRDGCYTNELKSLAGEILKMPNLELYGVGTNLSCVNEVLPSEKNMALFENAVNEVQKEYNINLPIVSGGASSSINMLFDGKLPKVINNMRMGESIFLGNIPVYDVPFDGAREDNFILKAEIIELKEKPSVPETLPQDCDKLMKRAIVAIGKQDIYLPGLICADKRMKIVGGSSDHVVLDVTDCSDDYKVGSVVDFKMTYNCLHNAKTTIFGRKNL